MLTPPSPRDRLSVSGTRDKGYDRQPHRSSPASDQELYDMNGIVDLYVSIYAFHAKRVHPMSRLRDHFRPDQ